jgi:GST-like protein
MLTIHATRSPEALKPLVALEELRLTYHFCTIERFGGPGARAAEAPLLTDDDDDRFAIFSPTAALLHLAEREPRLLPAGPASRAVALQWLGWESAALGPLEAHRSAHPQRAWPPVSRDAARTALALLDRQLARGPFLMGTFGITDIAVWPWARAYRAAGVPMEGLVRASAWLDAIEDRPAARRALARLQREGVAPTPPYGSPIAACALTTSASAAE